MNKCRSKSLLFLLILFSAGLAALRFNGLQIGTSYDDAHYVILAESLGSGQGYQLINFPRPQVERNFPPGWPLLLAPFTKLWPQNYEPLKLVSLALWLASLPLIYKLFSKRLASPSLELLLILVALNPLLVGTSVTLMSETAYLFFSILALVIFDKTGGRKIGLMIAVALLAFYSQQIRTIGIALSASLFLHLLLTRRFRDLGTASVILFVGILFQAWINLHNGGAVISSGYEAQVLDGTLLEKVGQAGLNASGYFNEVLSGALMPIFGSRLDSVLANSGLAFLPTALNILTLSIILLGMFLWKPRFEWMNLYVVIYFVGILAFWNPRVGSVKARFLIPLLPFLYFYFLYGLRWVLQKIFKARFAEQALIGIPVLIALALFARNLQDWRSPFREQMTDLSIGTSWVAEHAQPDAIVMVNEPVPAYVHVKRKTIGFPKNDQELEFYLKNRGIDYIVVAPPLQSPPGMELDNPVKKQILPVLLSEPEKYRVVFEDPSNNVMVFEYRP